MSDSHLRNCLTSSPTCRFSLRYFVTKYDVEKKFLTEAEANRGIVHLTEAEAEEKSPFLGKTEAEAEDSVDPWHP